MEQQEARKMPKWAYVLIGVGAAGLTMGGALAGAAAYFTRSASRLKNPRFALHSTSPDGKKVAVIVETQEISDYRYDLWVTRPGFAKPEHYKCLGTESYTEPAWVEWSEDSRILKVHSPGAVTQTVDLTKDKPTPAWHRPPWP